MKGVGLLVVDEDFVGVLVEVVCLVLNVCCYGVVEEYFCDCEGYVVVDVLLCRVLCVRLKVLLRF